MKKLIGSLMLLSVSVCATTAHASDTDIFAGCDGFGKPGKSADGLGAPASTTRFSFYNARSPGATISACTDALAHPKLLQTQGLRRAHLLRARAIAHLRNDNMSEALNDIDLAAAATNEAQEGALYKRSLAVSLDLLRALVYDRMGNRGEVLRLVREAAPMRPYALEVQRIAAHLLLINGESDPVARTTLLAASQLDPEFSRYQLALLGLTGNFKALVELAPPLEEGAAPTTPKSLQDMLAARGQVTNGLLLAYARAATGDAAGARRDLKSTKAQFEALSASPVEMMSVDAQHTLLKPYGEVIAAYEARIEARIAIQEGRTADALARIKDIKMPVDAVTTDLMKVMKISFPDGGNAAQAATSDRQTTARRSLFVNMAELAIIEPETKETNSVYKRSRPNVLGALVGAAVSMGTTLLSGVQNTDGFSAKQNPDGSVQVSIIARTTSATVVREMALLRAAELTVEAGKSSFVIVSRNDYTRTLTSTQYGMMISSIPSGYKTDMVIRFPVTDQPEQRAIDANAVIQALGPFYYKDSNA